MTREESVAFLKRYLSAVEEGATGAALAQFYEPSVVMREHPNRFSPNGATRDLAAILASAEAGQAILAWQRYALHDAIVDGDCAAITLTWTGALKVDAPHYGLKAGAELRAQIAQIYRFANGRIAAQQTFDCAEPL
jgi:ketosteroid isomerase-like protein